MFLKLLMITGLMLIQLITEIVVKESKRYIPQDLELL